MNYLYAFITFFLLTSLTGLNDNTKKEKVLLRLNPPENAVYSSTFQTTVNSLSPIGDINVSIDVNYETKILDKSSEAIKVSNEIQQVKTTMEMMGNTMTFDSSQEEQEDLFGNQMATAFEPIIGYESVLTLSPKGEILEMADFSEAFPNNPDAATQMQEMSKSLENAFIAFPQKQVGVGDSWDMEYEMPMQDQDMLYQFEYTLEDISQEAVKLKVTGVITDSTSDKQIGEISGDTYLDATTFWVKSATMNTTMTVDIQGSEMVMDTIVDMKTQLK